jgi:hypothetical protein
MVSKVIKIGTVIAGAIVIVMIGVLYLLPSYTADSTANANKLEILNECLRSGGTEIVVEDGLVQSRAYPDTMLNEDQLKAEWESHTNLYQQDCYYRADLTPQQVEGMGQ